MQLRLLRELEAGTIHRQQAQEEVERFWVGALRKAAIDGDIAEKLFAESPFYTAYTIPAGTYAGQDADVTTVTVKATLIVSASASEDDVYNLTKAIFENTEAIAAENGKGAELSIENATSGMTAPFHAGAAKYFAEKGVTVETK